MMHPILLSVFMAIALSLILTVILWFWGKNEIYKKPVGSTPEYNLLGIVVVFPIFVVLIFLLSLFYFLEISPLLKIILVSLPFLLLIFLLMWLLLAYSKK